MADDAALALQAAVVARLKADAGVGALVGDRVYDMVPAGAALPYVTFGDCELTAYDTDEIEAVLADFSVRAHSQDSATRAGRVEVTRVMSAVRAALHRQEEAMAAPGHDLSRCQFKTSRVARDAGTAELIGILALEAVLQAS